MASGSDDDDDDDDDDMTTMNPLDVTSPRASEDVE
jgi:hypothetical protein